MIIIQPEKYSRRSWNVLHNRWKKAINRLASMAAIIVCVQKVILHNKKRKILCKTTKEQKHEKMSNLMLTFLMISFRMKIDKRL